ncbi:MAG TPA: hemerythrin domain-containing protein, partial [Terriglobia bacterium]|nr:hemerythrin domain-containing protein [Terriglobia bacterium]
QCHHTKEEELLFPALVRKGIPHPGGPVGVMLHEHEEGRALIREMAKAGEALQSGDSEAGSRWAKAARQYGPLLRDHIFKENNILFVMAERVLTPEELEHLAVEFDRVEIEKLGAGTHERLHEKMHRVIAELAVPALG